MFHKALRRMSVYDLYVHLYILRMHFKVAVRSSHLLLTGKRQLKAD